MFLLPGCILLLIAINDTYPNSLNHSTMTGLVMLYKEKGVARRSKSKPRHRFWKEMRLQRYCSWHCKVWYIPRPSLCSFVRPCAADTCSAHHQSQGGTRNIFIRPGFPLQLQQPAAQDRAHMLSYDIMKSATSTREIWLISHVFHTESQKLNYQALQYTFEQNATYKIKAAGNHQVYASILLSEAICVCNDIPCHNAKLTL